MKVSSNDGTHNHTTAQKESGHNTIHNITTAYLADNDKCTVQNFIYSYIARLSYNMTYLFKFASYIVTNLY